MRYTSGSAGRFGFDHANRMAGAVDLAETAVRGHLRQRQRPAGLRPIIARLVKSYENIVQEMVIWDWIQVAPAPLGDPETATAWNMVAMPEGDQPLKYGPFPSGYAIQISGDVGEGAIVELIPISGTDGRIWFTFSSPHVGTVVLKLGTSELSEAGRVFQCEPMMWLAGSTVWRPHPTYKPGVAMNLCGILPDGSGDTYGQHYDFHDLGFMETDGAMLLNSYVIGKLRSIEQDGTWHYVFGERNNVIPHCAE